MYYFKYFYITSIIGFIIESFVYGNFGGSSGILFGPWTVVYGFGTIVILLIYKLSKKITKNKIIQAILIFILSIFALTLLEFIGGILIERIFNIVFWDYSDCKYNLGKYICLEMSLLWGLASLAFIYLFKPLVDKIIGFIPHFVVYVLTILITIDLIMTIVLKM